MVRANLDRALVLLIDLMTPLHHPASKLEDPYNGFSCRRHHLKKTSETALSMFAVFTEAIVIDWVLSDALNFSVGISA